MAGKADPCVAAYLAPTPRQCRSGGPNRHERTAGPGVHPATTVNGASPVSTTSIRGTVAMLGVCPVCGGEYTLTQAGTLPAHPRADRAPFTGPIAQRPRCDGHTRAPVSTRPDTYIRPAGCTYYCTPLAVA